MVDFALMLLSAFSLGGSYLVLDITIDYDPKKHQAKMRAKAQKKRIRLERKQLRNERPTTF